MENSELQKKVKHLNSSSFDIDNTIQSLNKTMIQVRLNEEYIFNVVRKNMLEKSLYFQAIQQTCFKDHHSEFIEVKYPAEFNTFKEVMRFINYGIINLDSESNLEVYQIAVYLQMDELQQFCLEYFTYNLNREILEIQLNMFNKYLFYDRRFKERALKFKESGRDAFSGLYFMYTEASIKKITLKYFSKETSSVSTITDVNHNKNEKTKLELQYFCKTLVVCTALRLPNSHKSLIIMIW